MYQRFSTPRKGFKGFKDLKVYIGGKFPPIFERQKGTPRRGDSVRVRCALTGAAQTGIGKNSVRVRCALAGAAHQASRTRLRLGILRAFESHSRKLTDCAFGAA